MQIVIEINDIPKNDHERWVLEHGTPLPKGHGRLIDADKLIKWCESNDDKLMSEYYINHIAEELIIIEADKGD